MRVLIYTGKGGVGKTSIAAATAAFLADRGKRVLIMSTDQAHSLSDSFDIAIGAEPTSISDGLDGLEIDPVYESKKAWGNLRDYLKQIISEKANGGIEAEEVLLFPGLDELFSMLRILDGMDSGRYDVIVVDCAPTGETLSLLRYPERLGVLADKIIPLARNFTAAFGGLVSRTTSVPKPRDEVFTEFDKLIRRLNRLQDILRDRTISDMRIVMTPERIVMEEARRSFTWINAFDYGIDAVYINKIYPESALEGYFSGWNEMQKEMLKKAEESFGDCKVFSLLLQQEEVRGIEMLRTIAQELYKTSDPYDVFCKNPAFRMEDNQGSRYFIVTLPYAKKEELEVFKSGEDLILTVRNETRRFHLPDRVSRRNLSDWTFTEGELRIQFDYD